MKYFRVLDDLEIPHRWYLKSPITNNGVQVDPWQFVTSKQTRGCPPLVIPIRENGKALDFTFAGFDIPVVSRHVQQSLSALVGDQVQFLDVVVEGPERADEGFAILNVLRVEDCLDESRSEYVKWSKSDGRPDLAGKYRMVSRLVVDSSRADSQIFRIARWEVALIVSGAVRDALSQFTGIWFDPVS